MRTASRAWRRRTPNTSALSAEAILHGLEHGLRRRCDLTLLNRRSVRRRPYVLGILCPPTGQEGS